jgi:hypothetical protein
LNIIFNRQEDHRVNDNETRDKFAIYIKSHMYDIEFTESYRE